MKKFQVTVNGNIYEVEVQELGGSYTPVQPSAVQVQQASTPVAPAATPAPSPVAQAIPENATKVGAPMPGKIMDIKVKVGDQVKEGDLVAVLEAMKMENEIFAPASGSIASINVNAGAMVQTNDVIVTIK